MCVWHILFSLGIKGLKYGCNLTELYQIILKIYSSPVLKNDLLF